MKIAVIGAGNGGQAIAGFLGMKGHSIRLFNRDRLKVTRIVDNGGINLQGAIEGFGSVELVSEELEKCIIGAELIMVATTANAHKSLAAQMASFLKDGQIIVLNPGRTLGALEFHMTLIANNCLADVKVLEAQSLVYACRIEVPGTVRIIGVKKFVPVSSFPKEDVFSVIDILREIYDCFHPVRSSLITGLENIGAIFHPGIVIANASRIERGESFYFYNEITAGVSNILEELDKERCEVGKRYGIELRSAKDWIADAYDGIEGNDLFSRMKNNPAYAHILAPKELRSRLLLEDIPTGLIPMIELGKLAGLTMPLMNALVNISKVLLNENFDKSSRTMNNLGIEEYTVEQIKDI